MRLLLTVIAATLLCSCAAQSSTATVERPTEEQIRQARMQTALRRLGEEREGVRLVGTATYVVVCENCFSDTVCDEESRLRAVAMRDQACPSGKGHLMADVMTTVRSARACTAKCYRFEMPANSYACD
ncbi:hypothetical protein HZC53_02195 [Candidatus Uhrbacteria bacterium]|nr:hypothetical protein [Candidatus Uhrbacteria bacterium]